MRVSLIASLFVVAACASPPPPEPVEPLDVRERFEVDYSGFVETFVVDDLLPAAGSVAARQVDEGTPQVRIDARIVRMPGAEATRLLGLEGAAPEDSGTVLGGGRVDRVAMNAAIDVMVERGIAEEVSAPSLVAAVGHSAKSAIARQFALVRSFRIATSGARFIADPVIEQVSVGLSLDTRADGLVEDGSMDLEVEARVVDMIGDLRRIDGSFDGVAELALQVPLACRQRLAGGAHIEAGEALFLAGLLVPGSGDVLVVFVDARSGAALAGTSRPMR